MTNPVSGDNFLSRATVLERKNSEKGDRQVPREPASSQSTADSADVERGARRLSQQTEGTTGANVIALEQAQRLLAELKTRMQANPQMAAAANQGISMERFEAAVARPTD